MCACSIQRRGNCSTNAGSTASTSGASPSRPIVKTSSPRRPVRFKISWSVLRSQPASCGGSVSSPTVNARTSLRMARRSSIAAGPMRPRSELLALAGCEHRQVARPRHGHGVRPHARGAAGRQGAGPRRQRRPDRVMGPRHTQASRCLRRSAGPGLESALQRRWQSRSRLGARLVRVGREDRQANATNSEIRCRGVGADGRLTRQSLARPLRRQRISEG